ncbi:hypothetical protein J132_10926 [Termitomyces sp. J132]|nr:hypothetical protein J132_10926 [Termitomyces sp. J132]
MPTDLPPTPSSRSISAYALHRDRLEYHLTVRQEPKQARMCGVGGKADRRPIDPPPIVQLRVVDPAVKIRARRRRRRREDGSEGEGNADDEDDGELEPPADLAGYAQSFLQNPYYFMFASLAKPDDDKELHWLKDGRTRCTTGSVVSSLYHLKDPHNANEDAGFFVFPDLSVRTEGSYRLKLSLFEVVGNQVRHCKSIYSAPFYVYTAKKFPGMEESTPLSCSLADQGIKIRIRKDIRVRKRTGGGKPTPSHHPSRPSFDVHRNRILDEVDKSAQTRHNVRKQALLRDGYRCTLTGLYDMESCKAMPEIEQARLESAKPCAFLEMAHIFSESTQDDDKNHAATIFAILDLFGLKERTKSLYGRGTNELHNVITMAGELHTCFDHFELWLEPVHNEDNTYDIRWSPGVSCLLIRSHLPDRVTFRVEPGTAAAAAAKGKQLKLPDPVLIAIRAACTRVANLSGAAEQIGILRDREEMPVLANDGSMAELLSSCLMFTSQAANVSLHGITS